MKSLLKTLSFTVALTCFSAAASHAAVQIRIGGTGTPGGPDTKAIEVIKEELEKKLGDAVEVKLFTGSTLGTWSEMAEQVKGGVLECFYESVGTLGSYNAAANIEGVAYIYRDENHFFKIWRGPVGKKITDSIAKDSALRVLGPAFRGFRQFLVKKPVDSLADLQGMKIRVPGIPAYIASIQALGVNPTSIAFEEAYAALQQGVVDGLEQPLVAIKDHRFYEVAKHLVITNHMAETMGLLCGEPWYQGLDPTTRAALDEAANKSADWYRDYTKKNTDAIITELKTAGVVVHTPDLSEFAKRMSSAKFEDALQPVIDKIRAAE